MRTLALILVGAVALLAQKYDGPRPPKKDLPYLLHASSLIATEASEAQQAAKGKDDLFTVNGASSSAKTPLAEPIFLMAVEKLQADSLELYKFDVKNGRRELTLAQKRKSNNRPIRMSVTRVEAGLFRIEASETLENGEYGISPTGSNRVFCFQVF